MCKSSSKNKIRENWITFFGAVISSVACLPAWICTLIFLLKLLVEIRFLGLLWIGKLRFCLVIILRFGTYLSSASYKLRSIKSKLHFFPRLEYFYTKKHRGENNSAPVCPDLRKNSSVTDCPYFFMQVSIPDYSPESKYLPCVHKFFINPKRSVNASKSCRPY